MLSIDDVKSRGEDIVSRQMRDDMLVHALSQNAYTIREVAEKLGLSIPGAMGRLNKMVDKGFLKKKRVDGILHYYADQTKND